MIEFVPARPEMIRMFNLQAAQRLTGQTSTEAELAGAIAAGFAVAAVDEGRILGMAGVAPKWEGSAIAWGLLSGSIGATFPVLHRAAARYFAVAPFARIEAHVAVEHPAGARWVEMLGFQKEGVMRKFFNSRDFLLYARVRD